MDLTPRRFRLRRHGPDQLAILTPRHDPIRLTEVWEPVIVMDCVWAANLAAELDAWLAGTDDLPDMDSHP